jgi:hypothetical protein
MPDKDSQEPGFLTFRRNIRLIGEAEERVNELKDRIDRGISSKLKKQAEEEIEALSVLSRRAALKTLGGGAGLIAAAALGLKMGFDRFHDGENASQNQKEQQGQTATFPGMTVMADKKVEFGKPQGLEMDESEFVRISKGLGQSVAASIKTNFGQKPGDPESSLIDELRNIIDLMGRVDPKIREACDAFTKKDSATDLLVQINEYLNPGGHYLKFETDDKKGSRLMVRPIVGSKHILLKSPAGNSEVKVLDLGGDEGYDPESGGHLGTVDLKFNTILMFPDMIRKFLGGMIPKLPDYPRFKESSNTGDLIEKSYEEYLYHEAIHMFLRHRFPGISTDLPVMMKIIKGVRLEVERGDGKIVDLSGNYSVQMIHELTAFGGQLMYSKTSMPLGHGMMLRDATDFPPDHHYHLLYRMLPYVTLAKAPDSDYKRQMLEGLRKDGKAHAGDAVVLIGHPPFSPKDGKEVGKLLYAVGFDALQQLEKQYRASGR